MIRLLVSPALLALLLLAACSKNEPAARRESNSASSRAVAAVRAASAPQSPPPASAAFTGIEACRECHKARVATYEKTNHFRTLRLPTAEDFGDRFGDAGHRLETRNPNLAFTMTRETDGWFQTAVEVAPNGETATKRRIDLVVGSGKLFEGYFTWQGDALFQLPIGWMAGRDTWANCPGFHDGEAQFDRPVRPRCLDCHATYFANVAGSDNRYAKEQAILGISCERCHGPGGAHVAWHRSNSAPADPHFIIQPGLLTRAQRLDQCGQCHGNPGTLKKPAFTYVPGTPLADYVRQETGSESTFVHTANQIQRLSESKCFKASDRLECIACHDPHRVETTTLVKRTLEECAACHRDGACKAAPTLPPRIRGDCIACHMPRRSDVFTTVSTKSDDFLEAARMTEHRIGVFADESERVRILDARERGDAAEQASVKGAAEATATRLLARATAAVDDRRFMEAVFLSRQAAGLDPTSSAAPEALALAIEKTRRAVLADRACARGLEALTRGEARAAEGSFLEALAADAGHVDANFNLGLLLLEGDQAKRAVDRLERAAKGSNDADVLNAWGLALARLGRNAEAELRFGDALIADPAHAGAHVNLARSQQRRGDFAAAIRHYKRFLEAEPNDAAVRHDLAVALAACARLDEAIVELEAVLAIDSGRTNSICVMAELEAAKGLVPEALRRLDKLLLDRPADAAAHRSRGAVLARLGRADDALAAFTDSLTHDPNQPEVLASIAEVMARLGRGPDAVKALEEAVRIALAQKKSDLATSLQLRLEETRRALEK